MNTNEIKYIEDNEPTPEELDNRLVTLACNQTSAFGDMSQFYPFLIGWMSGRYHKEMGEAAQAWLETHHPELLEEFFTLNQVYRP